MQIITPGKQMDGQWKAEFECTGKGNGGKGCGAVLEITEGDIYGTYNSCMGRDETFFATFLCPCCGTENDIASSDGYRHPNWNSARLNLRNLPRPTRDRVKAAQRRLQNGEGYLSPRKTTVEYEQATSLGPNDTLWVKEHDQDVWHRSEDKDGWKVLCDAPIPGAPTVARRRDNWEPPEDQRCPECEARK